MKNRRPVLTGFLAISLVMSLLAGTAAALRAPVQSVLSESSGYLIRTEAGSIRVYQNGELLRDTGISPAGLPREDRESLSRGLMAETGEELLSLLEDFSS